jgi:hypothetical protein
MTRCFCCGEAMAQPRRWSDLPDAYRERFQQSRTPEGFAEALAQDVFVEQVLPNGVLGEIDAHAHGEYRRRKVSGLLFPEVLARALKLMLAPGPSPCGYQRPR